MKFIKSSGLSITHRIPNIVAVHPRQQPLGMVFRTHSVAPSHRCGADAVQTLRRLVRMQRRTQRE
ncbi:hypothetical protein ABRY59_24295, partial [Ralstonia pseudosolanacearum]